MPDPNFVFFTGVDRTTAGQHIGPGKVSDMRNFRADTGSLVKRPGISRLRDLDMGLGALYWPLCIYDFALDYVNDWGAQYSFVMPPEGPWEWADVPDFEWDNHPVPIPPGWDADDVTVINVNAQNL